MIYLMQVEMYTTQFGDLREKNSHYSNVYENKGYAVAQGIKWLNKQAEILKSTYKHLENDTLEQMIKDKSVVYSLKLTQIKDLRYAQNFKIPESEAGCLKVNHTHIVYNYDYKGNVINWTIEYRDPNSDFAYFMMRYPRRWIT